MLKQLRNKKEGIVFVTVLLIIIVMMVLCISVISMNVSQVMIAEGEVKRIQAEILALGALTYTFANQQSISPATYITYDQILDNVTFTVISNIDTSGSGPLDTSPMSIEVYY